MKLNNKNIFKMINTNLIFIGKKCTQEELKNFKEILNLEIDSLISAFDSNGITPLDAFIQIRLMEDAMKKAKEQILSKAVEEAKNHPNSFEWKGFNIEQKKGVETFDFSNCPEIVLKESELKSLKETYKKSYKNYKGGFITVDGQGMWKNPLDGFKRPLPTIKIGENTLALKK